MKKDTPVSLGDTGAVKGKLIEAGAVTGSVYHQHFVFYPGAAEIESLVSLLVVEDIFPPDHLEVVDADGCCSNTLESRPSEVGYGTPLWFQHHGVYRATHGVFNHNPHGKVTVVNHQEPRGVADPIALQVDFLLAQVRDRQGSIRCSPAPGTGWITSLINHNAVGRQDMIYV